MARYLGKHRTTDEIAEVRARKIAIERLLAAVTADDERLIENSDPRMRTQVQLELLGMVTCTLLYDLHEQCGQPFSAALHWFETSLEASAGLMFKDD
jgi:hypothetical protein